MLGCDNMDIVTHIVVDNVHSTQSARHNAERILDTKKLGNHGNVEC
jgi:hypothetical protein